MKFEKLQQLAAIYFLLFVLAPETVAAVCFTWSRARINQSFTPTKPLSVVSFKVPVCSIDDPRIQQFVVLRKTTKQKFNRVVTTKRNKCAMLGDLLSCETLTSLEHSSETTRNPTKRRHLSDANSNIEIEMSHLQPELVRYCVVVKRKMSIKISEVQRAHTCKSQWQNFHRPNNERVKGVQKNKQFTNFSWSFRSLQTCGKKARKRIDCKLPTKNKSRTSIGWALPAKRKRKRHFRKHQRSTPQHNT